MTTRPYRPISATFRARHAAAKPNTYHCVIELSGLAAIMVFLLALFIVRTGTYHDLPVYSPNLPYASHASPQPAALREDSLRIFLERDGQVFFNERRVSLAELQPKLREGVRNGSEKRIYIYADRRARYGTLKLALDEVRSAGIQNVCFFADRPDDYASHATIHK